MKRMIAAVLAAATGAPLAASAGDVLVAVDSPARYALPDGVESVFVANPTVADVRVVSARQMMVLGRVPGTADIVLYGASGARLDTVRVRVTNARTDIVTLYNGAERYSFHCVDRCEQTPMIGDGGLADINLYAQSVQRRAAMSQLRGSVSEQPVDVPVPQDPAAQAPAPQPSAPADPAS